MKMTKSLLSLVLLMFLLPSFSFAITSAELVHLGNVAGREEKYKEALQDYTKAIKINHDDADAFYNRGYILIKLGKYNRAVKDLDRAITLQPEFAAAYHVRGIAFFDKKQYHQAVEDFTQAISLEPDNIKFYYSRMSAYCKLGSSSRAWEDVIKIQKMGGTVNPTLINILKNRNYRDNG